MKTKYLKVDGTTVPQGHCVVPDHRITTVTIELRSISWIDAEVLKAAIERRYEVTDMEVTEQLIVVK